VRRTAKHSFDKVQIASWIRGDPERSGSPSQPQQARSHLVLRVLHPELQESVHLLTFLL